MGSSKKKTDTPSFRMWERDFAILQDIAACGGLTAEQIGMRRFKVAVIRQKQKTRLDEQDSLKLAIHSNCQRRMKLLLSAGFVRRIERYQLLSEGKKPYLYTLTPYGAESLAEFLGCDVEDLHWRKKDSRLRPNYVEHLILTNNVRLAIERAVEKTAGIELVTWHDELTLTKLLSADKIALENADGNVQYVSLVPDAYFVLRNTKGELRHHFLEIDRGTETAASSDESSRTWARKIRTYIEYFYSDRYEERYGTTGGRLLTVTTSHKRLLHLKAVSESVEAKQRFWFTTHAQVSAPNLQYRGKAVDKAGRVIDTFEAVIPDVLSDALWLLAKGNECFHTLCENFL